MKEGGEEGSEEVSEEGRMDRSKGARLLEDLRDR